MGERPESGRKPPACPLPPDLHSFNKGALIMAGALPNEQTRLGHWLRLPLRLIPPSANMPILAGPLRGLRWTVGSHTHGCWLGSYEKANQIHWERHLKPGMAVFDIGANVGFYTLLASVLVGPSGRVVAFEPLPRNLGFLHGHVSRNRRDNVRIIEAAVAEVPGEATFEDVAHGSMARLSTRGSIRVKVVALDDLTDRGEIPEPQMMKIDVEGAEIEVLKGATRLIQRARPTLFLSTHGADVHAACLTLLGGWGYRCTAMDNEPIECSREVLAVPG